MTRLSMTLALNAASVLPANPRSHTRGPGSIGGNRSRHRQQHTLRRRSRSTLRQRRSVTRSKQAQIGLVGCPALGDPPRFSSVGQNDSPGASQKTSCVGNPREHNCYKRPPTRNLTRHGASGQAKWYGMGKLCPETNPGEGHTTPSPTSIICPL